MERKATAHWTGDLKTGNGNLQTDSQVLNKTPYSYNTRFESEKGTNPEELLAAAHAGCFTMAVAAEVSKQGGQVEGLTTDCTITLKEGSVTGSHLAIRAAVKGMNYGEFEKIVAEKAKGCIISRSLNIPITFESQF